jgi:hypothetical protein
LQSYYDSIFPFIVNSTDLLLWHIRGVLAATTTKRHHSRFLLRHFAPMSPLQPTSVSPSLGFTRFGLDWFNAIPGKL